MTRLLPAIFILSAATVVAQQPEAQTQPEKPAAPASTAPTPEQPAVEPPFTSSVEVGYRWTGQLHGSLDAYRSVVNLGEGPRLLNFDFNFVNPNKGWLDRMTVHGGGWGGDPYSTVRGELLTDGKYRFTFDHRTMAFFNALPSFANPNIQRGIMSTQSSYDTFHRITDLVLEFRPGTRIVPYFAYLNSGNTGRGISEYVSTANEYPVGTQIDDHTNNYRAGVHFEASKYHLSLEQGGTTFDNDQRLYTTSLSNGNRTTSFLGRTLFLGNLGQTYAITGNSIYSKGLFTARPAEWIDVYANFLYAQPKTDGRLASDAAGNFVQSGTAFAATEQFLITSTARQPHTSANGGFEVRPLRRVRIVESFLTDRFHTAGSLVSPTSFNDRLELNYNEQLIEVFVDATSRLNLRGGYKYVWGDALTRAPLLAQDFRLSQRGELQMNVGLAGLTYRVNQKFSVYADAEVGRGDRTYFRTALLNYERLRIRGSYQPVNTLTLSGSYSYFKNDNPAIDSGYKVDTRSFSAAVMWTPKPASNMRVVAEYARATFWSDTSFVVPTDLSARQRSFYGDKGNSGTALIELGIPNLARSPRLSFGGSMWRSTGTRPSSFYQPLARIAVPIVKHMDWNAEWRWYGMTEPTYVYESFRQNQALFSIRFY